MNELTYTQLKEILPSAKSFLEHAHEDLRDIGNRYFMLGCRLWEAQRYNYVEALGYESIEQLAEKEFDLGRSSTYNLINVYERFCDRGEYNQRKAWIDPKYKNYKYSQLIEMGKATCLSTYSIEKQIPPSTPIRILKEYIKYVNKNPGNNKFLPDWEEQQKTLLIADKYVPKEKQREEQNSIEQTKSEEIDFDAWLEKQPEGTFVQGGGIDEKNSKNEQPESVQTFGLPTCAKHEEKPKYNFSTRAGVRAFLNDCLHWKEKECYSPFIGCHYYMLKNKKHIYVYVQRTANKKNVDNIYEVIHRFFIDLNQYSNVPVEITKEQFEQYCAEHKDEL